MHADCVFSDFDGFRVLRAITSSTASLVGCTLANSNLVGGQQQVAVIQASGDATWNGSLVCATFLCATEVLEIK